jgi:cell division protease FtsH
MGLATVESQYLEGRASLTCSDVTAADIDTEVMKMLRDSYKQAKKMLKENREIMDKLAAHLIEKETITGKEFMEIYRREKGIPEPEEKDNKTEERFVEKPAEKPEDAQSGQVVNQQPGWQADGAASNQPQTGWQSAAPAQQDSPAPQPQQENVGLFSHTPAPTDNKSHDQEN